MSGSTGRAERPTTSVAGDPGSGPFSISEVARLTGLTATTLRAWQRRYGLTAGEVSRGGHRRYGRDDVARLRAMVELVGQGVPTAEAARVVLTPVEHGLALSPAADPAAHHLAAAALDLDGPGCRRLLRRHLQSRSVEATWCDLLAPVLSAVGEKWADLPHGIAVEHLLSHVGAAALGESARPVEPASVPHRPSRAGGAVLACVPTEQHDLPLVALAAALGTQGVHATLLGAATPAATLVEAVDVRRPAAVVVLALLRDLADPSVFDGLRGAYLRVAGGPGWADVDLPSDVRRVDDIVGAVQLVTHGVGPDRSRRS